MAKPTTFPEEHVSEPLVYRRISGFAIAGFALALGYALILVVLGARGMYDGSPLLLSAWAQAVPFASAALSGLALLLIARSGGLLAGGRLASIGLWLSIVFGLGYIAYYVATYFAIRQQADVFVERWFTKLEQGKINAAFLDTTDPAIRLRVNPDDEATMEARFNQPSGRTGQDIAKGPLDLFRTMDLVRIFTQSGNDVQVTPLGVREWDFKSGGYMLRRGYELTTPEGSFEVQVAVFGKESKNHEYEGREWTIGVRETSLKKTELTMLGKQAKHLRPSAAAFIDQWAKKLQAGDLAGAYLDTQPPEKREQLGRTAGNAAIVAAFTAAAAPAFGGPVGGALCTGLALDSELARCKYLPGYLDAFHRRKLVNTERLRTPEAGMRDMILNDFLGMLSPLSSQQAMRAGYFKVELESATEAWRVVDGDRILLPQDALFGFGATTAGMYAVEVAVILESAHGAATNIPSDTVWRLVGVDLLTGDQVRMPTRESGGGRLTPTPIRKPQPYSDPFAGPQRRMQ
jgi:hypothetical protein